MKKVFLFIITSLVILTLFGCDKLQNINVDDNIVKITYDIGEGVWEQKPNNKGHKFSENEKIMTIPAELDDEVELQVDSYYPRSGTMKVFPKLEKDGKTYYFSHWKTKGSNFPFEFSEKNKTKTGEPAPLYEDVYLEAVYNFYPGPTLLQSLAPKYRITNNIPCFGSPNILVVPLNFEEATSPVDNVTMKNNLELAFNSSNVTDTGFYSIKEYFKESSFNKFTPNFILTDTLSVKDKIKNLDGNMFTLASMNNTVKDDSTSTPERTFLSKLYNHDIFKNAVKDLDYDFDIDKNSILDGIIFIVDGSLHQKWQLNTNRLALPSKIKTKNNTLETISYTFISYSELFKPLINLPTGLSSLPNKNIGDSINGNSFKLNAVRYVREIYFQMGLPLSGKFMNGLYGFDGLDYPFIGDINSFYKIILGWIEPDVITSTKLKKLSEIKLNLDSTSTYYKPLIVLNSNQEETQMHTFFTKKDYLIIDYYNADAFRYNKLYADLGYLGGNGIRVSHIHPQLKVTSLNIETINQLSQILLFSNVREFSHQGVPIKLIDYVKKENIPDDQSFNLLLNYKKLLYQLNDTFNPLKDYKWHPDTVFNNEKLVLIDNSEIGLYFSFKVISLTGEIKIQIS